MYNQALHDPKKTCVVWMNAGHEVFQEARTQTTTLLEQAIAGYHEANDVVYVMSHPECTTSGKETPGDPGAANWRGSHARKNGMRKRLGVQGGKPSEGRSNGAKSTEGGRAFEDEYIDSVLSTMGDIRAESEHRARGSGLRFGAKSGRSSGHKKPGLDDLGGGGDSINGREEENSHGEGGGNDDQTEMGSSWDGSVGEVYGTSWERYRAGMSIAAANAAARRCGKGASDDDDDRWQPGTSRGHRKGGRRRRERRGMVGRGGAGESGAEAAGRRIMVGTVLDASHPAFERQDNLVYGFGQGSKVYPTPDDFPEVCSPPGGGRIKT